MRSLGVAGLALGVSIGSTLNLLLLIISLQKDVKSVVDINLLKMIVKITAAAFVMGIIIQLSKYPLADIFDQRYFVGILSQGLVAGILGFLSYGALCRLFKVEEMDHLQASLKKQWLRFRAVGEGIDEAEKL
jgi:putative peptidoglycan lipid II flippase